MPFATGLVAGALLVTLWYREPTLCERAHAEQEAVVQTMGREAFAVVQQSGRLTRADLPPIAARRADLERQKAEAGALIARHCPFNPPAPSLTSPPPPAP